MVPVSPATTTGSLPGMEVKGLPQEGLVDQFRAALGDPRFWLSKLGAFTSCYNILIHITQH